MILLTVKLLIGYGYDYNYLVEGTTTLSRDIAIKMRNGYRINVDIMTGEIYRQIRLLTWTSFIGQFINPVGNGG